MEDSTSPPLVPLEIMEGSPPTVDRQVTFRNYREWPYSTWAFRNAGAPLNLLMIPRMGAFAPFAERPDTRVGQLRVEVGNKKQTVEHLLVDHHCDGFLVLVGDEIVFERYYNGLTAHYRHIWYSATKSLAATCVGLLHDEGYIDLSFSPAYYIPELKGSAFERVTIQQVLDHCTAIDFKEDYANAESAFMTQYAPANNMGFMPGARDAQPGSVDASGAPVVYGTYDFLRTIRPNLALQPGEVFEYNSANADVAGWLVARRTGLSFDQFVHHHLWSHLGCEHDAAIACDRAYMAVATGGMNSTLRDAARFGQLIRDRGRFQDVQVLPAAGTEVVGGVEQIHRERMQRSLYRDDGWEAYHNMWWILDSARGEFSAVGIHGQAIYVDRRSNVCIVMFSSQPVAGNSQNPDFVPKLRTMRAISRYFDPR